MRTTAVENHCGLYTENYDAHCLKVLEYTRYIILIFPVQNWGLGGGSMDVT